MHTSNWNAVWDIEKALLEERLKKEGRSSPDTGSGAPAPG
jgi:hypothetical protein